MTREEIVKALRCCNSETECRGCPFEEKEPLLGPCAEKVLAAAADMLEQDALLNQELEAAKRDIAEMLVSTPECDWCKRYYDQSCEYPYCKNPLCYARDLLCKAVWRGPCAENGGKDDAH